MDGKKVYQIQINGIQESVNAVESLNKQLDDLEKRIKELGAKNIKIDGGGSSIKEQVASQKELNQLKKEEAAQQRLIAGEYANTMKGMKQNLADLKTVMNVTDLGDSDSIKKMTKDANELNSKLLEIEKSYGQFHRNVGNYRDAANGFKGLAIQVGDATKEFDNAKQALKELKKERDTLSVKKDLGLISEEEAERLRELIPTVAQLQSSIQDAGKPMDALMDSMQSFVAIMQSAKGISAFFGLDDTAVEESINKLVALQNAMQGLQTIQKQLQTQEGIGKWLSQGNAAIDAFTKKLFGLGKTAKVTNATIASTGTAGKSAAVGLGTASVAANTATKSFSLASAAATALRVVLSALGIGLIIGAISLVVEGISHLIDKQKEAKKFQEDLNNAVSDGEEEYAKASVNITQLKNKLDSFNGSKKQEKKLVEELNSKYGTSIGQYKSLHEWKDALIKKGEAYAGVLKLEAENQALLNMYTENYVKLMHARDSAAKGPSYGDYAAELWPWNWGGKGAQEKLNESVNEIESAGQTILDKIEENNKEIERINKENELFDYAPQVEKNSTKTKNAIDEAQRSINQLQLRLMQDGLDKKLRQLDEEERQTINKLQQNGRKSAEEIKKIQRLYGELRTKEMEGFLKSLEGQIKQSADNIKNIEFDINLKTIQNTINSLKNEGEKLSTLEYTQSQFMPLTSSSDLKNQKGTEDWLQSTFRSRYENTKEINGEIIKSLTNFYKDENDLTKEYIGEQEKLQNDAEEKRYSAQTSSLDATKKLVEDGLMAIENQYKVHGLKGVEILKDSNKKEEKEAYEHYHELDEIQKENKALSETAAELHKQKMEQISIESNNAIKKNEIDAKKEISSIQERYYDIQISNFRDFQSKLNDEISRNPVTNNLGIVDISQTRKNYKEIINAAKESFEIIEDFKNRIDNDLKDGLLTDEAVSATLKQIEDIENEIKKGMAATEEASKNLISDFIQSAQVYLQAAMDSFQTIMGAVWDAQDIAFEKQQEALDKENEMLDKALDKQQEIIEQHKSAIESIEDELATSRGDRRQHLIDQLNAEIEAQRRAQKEEERIRKQKEAAERKQDALEKKRKKAQYQRDLLQGIVNGAMAVTYAAMNTWPIPAIPLMALAASTTAAQIAIMAANKPYAKGGQLDGGVAQGKRHSEGGIPVLGGRASIEGGEFITNRRTTSENVDLLEYINAKHRKLSIDDFIDFYGNGTVKKNINSMSPRAKFADGGVIPTLDNTYSFDDRLLSAFEDYSNRPVYVSVVDINNRQAAVKNVQVLAGISD